jgi:hypothetical protein
MTEKLIDMPLSRFKFAPLENAAIPPAGMIEHIKDHWWIVHPEMGLALFEGKYKQCNRDEAMTRRLARNYPWAEVRQVPSAFFPASEM